MIRGVLMGKHYGEEIIEEVLHLKSLGQTHREIGEKQGLSKDQIHDLVKRHNRKERAKAMGIFPKPKGRPRIRHLTQQQKLELEIKRLEGENELLRSFLHSAGRM